MGTRQTSFTTFLVAGILVQTHPSLKQLERSAPTLCDSTQSIRLPTKEGNTCYSFMYMYILACAHTHARMQTPKFISAFTNGAWSQNLVLGPFPENCGNASFWSFFLTLVRNVIIWPLMGLNTAPKWMAWYQDGDSSWEICALDAGLVKVV